MQQTLYVDLKVIRFQISVQPWCSNGTNHSQQVFGSLNFGFVFFPFETSLALNLL